MSSIKDLREKIKGFYQNRTYSLPSLSDDLFLGIVIILIAFGSFGLGRLSKIEGTKTPIQIENLPPQEKASVSTKIVTSSTDNQGASALNATGNDFVGSKNGKKYYYPWCSGVKAIAPPNLIHFSSKSEAEARGYTPSATCKGL